MKKFVRFCIPTLFERKELNLKAFANLIRQAEAANIDYKIDIIANQNFDLFDQIDFGEYSDKVNTYHNREEFNISKSVNISLEQLKPGEYFCFHHDDMFIHDENWIEKCINISDDESMNAGVIGLRLHSTGQEYCIDYGNYYDWDIDKVLWADGIFWLTHDVREKVGLIDERYKGDREFQSYCYNAMQLGYNNFAVLNRPQRQWDHIGTPFTSKTSINTDGLLTSQREAEKLFYKEWGKWEREHGITKFVIDYAEILRLEGTPNDK